MYINIYTHIVKANIYSVFALMRKLDFNEMIFVNVSVGVFVFKFTNFKQKKQSRALKDK